MPRKQSLIIKQKETHQNQPNLAAISLKCQRDRFKIEFFVFIQQLTIITAKISSLLGFSSVTSETTTASTSVDSGSASTADSANLGATRNEGREVDAEVGVGNPIKGLDKLSEGLERGARLGVERREATLQCEAKAEQRESVAEEDAMFRREHKFRSKSSGKRE